MRENREFGKRTQVGNSNETKREAKRKFFIVCEGEKTEPIYFKAVNELKQDIGIDYLIDIILINRSLTENGWSNPKKILDTIEKNIRESTSGIISYRSIINNILDYLIEINEIYNIPQARTSLHQACANKLNVSLDDEVVNTEEVYLEILEVIRFDNNFVNVVDKVPEIIESGKITYEKDFDELCLVVDRDPETFTQYDYVLEKCKANQYNFYVTNPCFEFWLLLHFEEVNKINREDLLMNKKVNNKKRYTEIMLKNYLSNYKKEKYDAKKLVKNIDIAITNQKNFSEDINELKDNLGSNLGLLIEKMRGNIK